MKFPENRDKNPSSESKKSLSLAWQIFFAAFFLIAGIGSCVLYLAGVIRQADILRKLGVIGFAFYFLTAGGYTAVLKKKSCLFFFLLALVLVLLSAVL